MISVLFLTAWFLLAAMSAAHADPVSTAIATGLLGAAAQGTFVFTATVSMINLALGVGLNYAAQALLGKEQQSNVGGMSGTLQLGGVVPRSFIVGRSATAGSLSYAGTWGKEGKTPNAYLTEVIPVSDRRVKGLVGLYVDDAKVEIDYSNTSYGNWGYPVPAFADGTDNRMWVKFYDGTQTTADSLMLEKFGSDPDYPYTADMVGHGVAYAVVTTEFKPELFSGYPKFMFEIEGGFWYDPRLDTTNGGSGPQRWEDESTWAYTDNPAVILYNILRGIYFGDTWFYGLQGLVASRLPNASWFAAMNECDRLVPKAGGGTEKQYRCGGEIAVSTKVNDAVQALLTACNGRLAEIGGVYKLTVGAADAPVVAFTDDMLASTDPQTFDPFPSLETTINGIAATYPEPEEGYAPKDAPARYDAALEDADGDRRLAADVTYDLVPYKEQVQRLMQSALNEARKFRKHTLVAMPWAWILEPNDIVSWTSERNGYVSKLFRVDAVTDQADLNIGLVLVEVDPADYDWNPESDYIPVPVNPVVVGYPTPQPMYGWQAFPAEYLDANGKARRPTIGVRYAGAMTNVMSVRVLVREAWGSKRLVSDGVMPYDAPLDQLYSVILNLVLLPNADYEVSGQFIMRGGGPSNPSEWLPVRTPNILLGSDDVYLTDIVDEVGKTVATGLEWMAGGLVDFIREAQLIADNQADQDFANFQDKQTLRRELVLTADYVTSTVTAAFTEAITSAVGPGSALVQRIQTLEAKAVDLASGISANASAITVEQAKVATLNNQLTAVTNSVMALNSTVGNFSADGRFRVTTEATPQGALARIGLSVAVTGGDTTTQAAIFLDAISGGTSQIALVADRVAITSIGNDAKYRPFIIQGNELFADQLNVNWANIRNVSIGWADIQNAVVNNFVATTANIGNLVVGTSNLSFDSVTDRAVLTGSGSGGAGIPGGQWETFAQVVINNPNPNPVLCEYSLTVQVESVSGSGSGGFSVRWINLTTGGVLRTVSSASSGGQGPRNNVTGFYLDENSVQGNNTYALQWSKFGSSVNGNWGGLVKKLWWKR